MGADGGSPLALALFYAKTEMAQMLADPAVPDNLRAAAWLLDHGADPDRRHDFGGAEHGKNAVAMHLAAQFGSLKCLELLLHRGADPSIKDAAFEGTPLGWARHAGAETSIALLSHP